jgi:hypothetical protein
MRGGSALDANSKVPLSRDLPISIPLAVDQWKVEARALFETSLARIQIDLKDHVRGAAANVNGFANHIDSAFTNVCFLKIPHCGLEKRECMGFEVVDTVGGVCLCIEL